MNPIMLAPKDVIDNLAIEKYFPKHLYIIKYAYYTADESTGSGFDRLNSDNPNRRPEYSIHAKNVLQKVVARSPIAAFEAIYDKLMNDMNWILGAVSTQTLDEQKLNEKSIQIIDKGLLSKLENILSGDETIINAEK